MTNPDLYLKQLQLGPMENFVYLIGSKSSQECFVVDPAWEIQKILDTAQQDGMKIRGALVTHYHPDHVGGHLWGNDIPGLSELKEKLDIPIYAHKNEIPGLIQITGVNKKDFHACESGEKISTGTVDITLIHTPGHTPGSQCFLIDQKLVSGDTLFISGCGRVDLPGGDSEAMYESLTQKLAKLPKDTVLYPGHNYDSLPHATMEKVMLLNPYLNIKSKEEWRRLRG